MIVLVTGLPAAGKTTLARALAEATGLPMLSLDTVKEALVDGLGEMPADRYLVRRTALQVLTALATDNPRGAVMDIWVDPSVEPTELVTMLRAVPGASYREVICTVDGETAAERYAARARAHPAHLPHDDATLARIRDAAPLIRPLGIGPHLLVDTTEPTTRLQRQEIVEWMGG